MSLVFHSVSFSYDLTHDVLDHLDVVFPESGLVVILGRSGCGKTTLLSLIIGSLTPTSGKIERDADYFASPVFQSPLLLNYLTAEENVSFPLDCNGIVDKEETEKALRTVDMFSLKDAYPEKLSGGEKARISIARSLVLKSDLLVLDEPTGQLDEINSNAIMELIKKISKDHLVILVTHDEKSAYKYADILYLLEGGKLKEIQKHKINQTRFNENKPNIKNKGVSFKRGNAILSSFLKTHKARTFLSTVFVGFALSFLSTGLNLSRHFSSGMTSLLSQYYDYDVLSVSMKESIAQEGHVSLLRNRTPTQNELLSLGIGKSYADLSFFLPEFQEIGLSGHYATVRFLPLLNENIENLRIGKPVLESLSVVVNDSFLSEFSLSMEQALSSSFTSSRSVLVSLSDMEKSDFVSSSFRFSISGISKEKNLFNEATVYYSHKTVLNALSSISLEEIRKENSALTSLGELFSTESYQNEDIFSHARLITVSDIHDFEKKAKKKFGEDSITIESKALSIEESTSEILDSLLKIGFLFLLMTLMSAFMLEFIAIYSLYDENLRLFALSKVYSRKDNSQRFSFLMGYQFLSKTSVFLLMFSLMESVVSNIVLTMFSYPSFLSIFDFPSLFVTFLFSIVLCFLAGLLPMLKIKKKNLKKELEGED